MKVLYLVGMGRSGSTLLDILLDSHSRIQGLGGINRLAHYARRHPCPCGAPSFADCPFWSAVTAELQQRNGRDLVSADVRARDTARFQAENRAVFEAAGAAAGVDVVTDNSKSVGRLKRLMATPGLQVIPIHVVRDPRGRAQSIRKRKGQQFIPTFSYTYRSLRLYSLLHDREHIAVEYERFAAEPEVQLGRLMERLGLELEPEQLRWAEHAHHNIGAADVLRKTEGSTIRPDDGWEKALAPGTQRLINAIAAPGRAANDRKHRRWGL